MKNILLIFLLLFSSFSFSQETRIDRLKTVAGIWGECYLFHPSLVRSDKSVDWEKALVDFLPWLNDPISQENFLQKINENLLSQLDDPLTRVQPQNIIPQQAGEEFFTSNDDYDVIRITAEELSAPKYWLQFNQLIQEKMTRKPLVIDVRINKELELDARMPNSFDMICALLVNSSISLGSKVSREHVGWDELNTRPLYEQRWNVANLGTIKPLRTYKSDKLPEYMNLDLQAFRSITRPVTILFNNTFYAYYAPYLKALKLLRPNTSLIWEKTGNIYLSWFSNLVSYEYPDFTFVLNPFLYLNQRFIDFPADKMTHRIGTGDLKEISSQPKEMDHNSQAFTMEIIPMAYATNQLNLSNEEKLLGLIKTWTIIKYFYPHHDRSSIIWGKLLEEYIPKVEKSRTDHQYFTLLREIMSRLNDSQVSMFHASIIDASKEYIPPVQFEWIDGKLVVTAVDEKEISGIDIRPGDEIIQINRKKIPEIIEENRNLISASTEQAFYASVFTPRNFAQTAGSLTNFVIRRGELMIYTDAPCITQVSKFNSFGDPGPSYRLLNGNIGYLNLGKLTDNHQLEMKLMEMKDTRGLILDLRNGEPTEHISHFIRMLASKPYIGRVDNVPVLFANKEHERSYQITRKEIVPDPSFHYPGTIAVLVDHSMIGLPENIAVILKGMENVFFVGKPTQGAAGEITRITLPGGGETSFTGQKIMFGDGSPFQTIGITPDYIVHKTVDGIKQKQDEILEKALEIIRSKLH